MIANATVTLLRIASYNIHRCVGNDRRCDPARIAEVIQELSCDTVALQEVDNRASGGHDSMQLDFIAAATRMEPIAGLTIVRHEGSYGNALLTRRPVLAVRRHDLSFVRREPRGALDVELDVGGQAVRIVLTHLGLRPAERRYQVQRLLHLLDEAPLDQPLVVLGDINEWLPWGRPLRSLHRLLGRAPAARSFPSHRPLIALDRIWVKPAKALVHFNVHRSASARIASDHLPVSASIQLSHRSERA